MLLHVTSHSNIEPRQHRCQHNGINMFTVGSSFYLEILPNFVGFYFWFCRFHFLLDCFVSNCNCAFLWFTPDQNVTSPPVHRMCAPGHSPECQMSRNMLSGSVCLFLAPTKMSPVLLWKGLVPPVPTLLPVSSGSWVRTRGNPRSSH